MNFDIVIKDGKVIDGAGNPWFKADLGIKNGKIAKLGRLNGDTATKELDATDMIVSPGFIDPHSHSDRYIPIDPKVESTIRQGITTLTVGQCGSSPAPFNPDKIEQFQKMFSGAMPPGVDFEFNWESFTEFLTEMDRIGCASNVAHNIGFGTIRVAGGPGYENREPTAEEMDRMKELVAEAMQAGAFGMSTGLIYTPQIYAKTEEVIELTKVVAQYGGLYFSHIRNESVKVMESIQEAIEIVETSGCAGGQIAHLKVSGKQNWGKSTEMLRLISDAYERGLNVTADQYPYNRSQTSLITAIHPWAHVGGTQKLLERLKNPADRKRIKNEISEEGEDWENLVASVGYDGLFISSVKTNDWKDMEGKSFAEITQLKGYPDGFTAICEALLADEGQVRVTCRGMGDEDIERIMKHPHVMVGTDGSSVSPTGILHFGKPHPRYYGTYPRVLGNYVREGGVLPLEAIIRKMTSFPAQKLRLWDRGLLREGMGADIVVFNPDTVIDRATFQDPHQFPIGIPHVIVNGELVVENEQHSGKLPGKILRRPT